MSKPWPMTFMEIAQCMASRSHCLRMHIGAVIANTRPGQQAILSTGYNGSPRGIEHCDHEIGLCEKRDKGGRCIGAHAEMNAIVNAARNGIRIEGMTLIVTCSPCLECAKHIINTGFSQVIYEKRYDEQPGFKDKAAEAQQAITIIEAAGIPCRDIHATGHQTNQ